MGNDSHVNESNFFAEELTELIKTTTTKIHKNSKDTEHITEPFMN